MKLRKSIGEYRDRNDETSLREAGAPSSIVDRARGAEVSIIQSAQIGQPAVPPAESVSEKTVRDSAKIRRIGIRSRRVGKGRYRTRVVEYARAISVDRPIADGAAKRSQIDKFVTLRRLIFVVVPTLLRTRRGSEQQRSRKQNRTYPQKDSRLHRYLRLADIGSVGPFPEFIFRLLVLTLERSTPDAVPFECCCTITNAWFSRKKSASADMRLLTHPRRFLPESR